VTAGGETFRAAKLNGPVLVLNGNYEPLHITTVRRAVSLIFTGKAEMILPFDGEVLRSQHLAMKRPSVIRLARYIRWIRREIPPTKRNILKRDRYTCQYCGTREGPMTVDHVVPRVLGGKDTWENLVCACVRCNNKKGDRTPEQAGMKLLRKPRRPHHFLFRFQTEKLPDPRWRMFLFGLE